MLMALKRSLQGHEELAQQGLEKDELRSIEALPTRKHHPA
jgi:hypothetical protein